MSQIDRVLVDAQNVDKGALRAYLSAREVVSVKDRAFGAVGNGRADDSAAFQKAFNAAANIFIPAGSYNLASAALTITGSNKRIFGEGVATRLDWSSNFSGTGITIAANHVQLQDLYLHKPRAAAMPNVSCIGIRNSSNTGSYINVKVSSEGRGGYLGWSTGMVVHEWVHKLVNCRFSAQRTAFYGNTANYITAANCSFSATSEQCVLLSGGNGNSLFGVNVEGNAPVGIYISDGGRAHSGTGTCAISGGYMEGQDVAIVVLGSAGPGKRVQGVTIHGILIYGRGKSPTGIRANRVSGLSITGVNCLNHTANSIVIGSETSDCLVFGNHCNSPLVVSDGATGMFQDINSAGLQVNDVLRADRGIVFSKTGGSHAAGGDGLVEHFGGGAPRHGAGIMLAGEGNAALVARGRLAASLDGRTMRYPLSWDARDGASRIGFYDVATPVPKQTVTGLRGGNAALADLLSKLAALGLINDATS